MDKPLFFLVCFPFCIFSLFWLNLFFGTLGRPKRLNFFYKQEAGEEHGSGTIQGGPLRFYLVTVQYKIWKRKEEPRNSLACLKGQRRDSMKREETEKVNPSQGHVKEHACCEWEDNEEFWRGCYIPCTVWCWVSTEKCLDPGTTMKAVILYPGDQELGTKVNRVKKIFKGRT